MNEWRLSENIVKLRHDKKITQEELASFAGVTKASVSKWENGQSLPDILLLPRLAAYFDVTVDALIGYEPQLTKEEIQNIYHELAEAFSKEPFEEVMEKSRRYVKQYYSCCPFLFQIAVLWLNHFMLAQGEEHQREILEEASQLCSHILERCSEIGIGSDALMLRAAIDLQLGRAEAVIGALEKALDPYRMTLQSGSVLIRAYQMAGEQEKADGFTQISMYLHLGGLIADAICFLDIHISQPEVCEETARRIENLDQIFGLSKVQANAMAQFALQAASVFCMQGKTEEALTWLWRYSDTVLWILRDDHLTVHGDSYFDRLAQWYEASEMGSSVPRDKTVIRASALGALSHPAFAVLQENAEFARIRRKLERGGFMSVV